MKILGIMTGTSLDGIDVSLVDFFENNNGLEFNNIHNNFKAFPNEFKKEINKLISSQVHISQIGALNYFYSELIVEFVNEIFDNRNLKYEGIDAIAVHGQTVWHETKGINIGDVNCRFSMQLINPQLISNRLKVPCIYDFRNADIVNGGEGAPLVPIFEEKFLRGRKNRALINIGGISNITYLPFSKNKDVLAFDCGPGNLWIDYLSLKYFGYRIDYRGQYASQGNIIRELLDELLDDEYYKILPPKSTGKEYFTFEYLEKIIFKYQNKFRNFDIIATITALTGEVITNSIKEFLPKTKEVVISGGGLKNEFLINYIKSKLDKITFTDIKELGIDGDFKESIAFAYLGFLFLNKTRVNLRTITNSKNDVLLGCICYP